MNQEQVMGINGPKKKIFDQSDIGSFKTSKAYVEIHRTLLAIVEKVKGLDVPSGYLDDKIITREEAKRGGLDCKEDGSIKLLMPPPSDTKEGQKNELENETIKGIVAILARLNEVMDETPPLPGTRRFGNLACRDWHAKIEKEVLDLLRSSIGVPKDLGKVHGEQILVELNYYLCNSFGSSVRLDYGTGHELSFLAFLGGLIKFGVLDLSNVNGTEVLIIFAHYYDLVRRLILVYSLEPAGSHGVWGLDDHFHLIYILGAAQFNENSKKMIPAVQQVLRPAVIEEYKSKNLYVNAIAFIHKIKRGPIHEHSPIIFDIHSTVSLWTKVLSGLIKMYDVEVLGKFPVVQHFWFGSLLFTWTDSQTNEALPFNPKAQNNSQEEINTKGFINGVTGTNTTKSNISMTGASWAMKEEGKIQTNKPPTRFARR